MTWDCGIGTPDEDHDWEIVSDWYGDPDVINGTCDFTFKRCRTCGIEQEELDGLGSVPDEWDDWGMEA